MKKMIIFIRRKPGISKSEFRAHYENVHAALVTSTFDSIGGYVRNYIEEEASSVGWAQQREADFDVITELWFRDDQAYVEFLADLGNAEKVAPLRSDEATFLDSDTIQTFLVSESGTSLHHSEI